MGEEVEEGIWRTQKFWNGFPYACNLTLYFQLYSPCCTLKCNKLLMTSNVLVFFCVAVCPNMTMEALDVSECSQNREVVLMEPSAVVFNCRYESPPQNTTYAWYMDGQLQPQMNSSMANIYIPSGSHNVTCTAFIDASMNSSNVTEHCTCTGSRAINVTIVGM